MPKGTKVLAAERSGMSAWTRTGKITVSSPEGGEKQYFIKVCDSMPDNRSRTNPGSLSPARVPELWQRVNITLHLP
jgi:hypothetical protein